MTRPGQLTDEALVIEAKRLLEEMRDPTSMAPARLALAKAIGFEGIRRALPAQSEVSPDIKALLDASLALDSMSRTGKATRTNMDRKRSKAERAVALRADGLSVEQIALRLNVRGRTVERYLAAQKTPTERRAVGRDDEIPG